MEKILGRARAGDQQAIAELASQYAPKIYRMARFLMNSDEEAKDISADIFARLINHPQVVPPENFSAWVMRVAYNSCCDRLRRQQRFNRLRPRLQAWFGAHEPGPEEQLMENEELSQVRRIIRELPETERMMVILRYYQELSYSEISEVLDIPESTVGTRLHRVRERIRERMKESEEGR